MNTRVKELSHDFYVAIIASILTFFMSIALATLVFSGVIANYFMIGLTTLLISNIISSFLLPHLSSYKIIGNIVHSGPIIIFLVILPIVRTITDAQESILIFENILFALLLTTFLTGALLYALGKFHLGNLVRFIPYPIIAAFMAAAGILILKGTWGFMTNRSSELWNFAAIPNVTLLQFGLCFLLGFILTFIEARWKKPILLPLSIIIALILFYIIIPFFSFTLPELMAEGWFFNISKTNSYTISALSHPFQNLNLGHIHWKSYLNLEVLSGLFTIVVLTPLGVLFHGNSIEQTTGHEFNYNNELKNAGYINMLSPFFGGGAINYLSYSFTMINYDLKAKTAWTGTFIALLTLFLLFFGSAIVQMIPKFIAGGMTIYLSLTLIDRWLLQSRKKMPFMDFLVLVIIMLIILYKGFHYGVFLGVLTYLILFDIKYSQLPTVRKKLSGLFLQSNVERSLAEESILKSYVSSIEIYVLQGYLFFGNTNNLIEHLIERIKNQHLPKLQFIILDFHNIQGVDFSSTQIFFRLTEYLKKYNIRIIMTHIDTFVYLEILKALKTSQEKELFLNLDSLDKGLEWCEDRILQSFSTMWNITFAGQLHAIFPNTEDRETLLKYFNSKKFAANELVFNQGEILNELYFLESGTVELIYEVYEDKNFNERNDEKNENINRDKQGNKDKQVNKNMIRLKILKPGVFFGESGVYLGMKQITSCITQTPSTICYITFDNLIKLEKEHPRLAILFHRFIIYESLHRIQHVNKTLLSLDML